MNAKGKAKIEWKNLLGFDQIADRQQASVEGRIGSKVGSPKPETIRIGSKIGEVKPVIRDSRVGSKVGIPKN